MFESRKLKAIRKKWGGSLDALSLELYKKYGFSVTKTTLANWENGVCKPTVDGLAYLSTFFSKPIVYFFTSKYSKTLSMCGLNEIVSKNTISVLKNGI